MNLRKLLFCISITVLLLTGCWDTINLEDRGFIVGSAVDSVEEDNDSNDPLYSITNQFVLPQGLASPTQSIGDEEMFDNITSTGRSVTKTNDEMSAFTSKTPYYGHLKIMIISEDIAKKEGKLTDFLDHYLRDVNVRRGVLIAIAKDDAKSILDFKPKNKKLPAINMKQLLEQSSEKKGFFKPLAIGDVEELHLQDRSFILPYLILEEQVERRAGAVFQGPEKKMVGVFKEKELLGLELFKNTATENTVDFLYKDHTFGFQIVRTRKKITIDTTNKDRLKIKNQIKVEGIIKEAYSNENFLKPGELNKVEDAVSKEIENLIIKATDKSQQLNADIFNIWKQMETKHNDTWIEVENDWESGKNYFSKADFDIKAETNIYSTGTSNKTN